MAFTHSRNAPPSPAFLKGFLWFTFSGTAFACAFILPAHILALMLGATMRLDSLPMRMYFCFLFFAGLYHGLYRTKTILFDLGLGQYQKAIDAVAVALFVATMSYLVWYFFIWL